VPAILPWLFKELSMTSCIGIVALRQDREIGKKMSRSRERWRLLEKDLSGCG
jgi:hypothetical protein